MALVPVDHRQAHLDARWSLAAATVALVAFVTCVVPVARTTGSSTEALGLLWVLGALAAMFLGPVAAGLAAYASLLTLWLRGEALPVAARRLHLLSLLAAAAFFSAYVSSWGTGFTDWLD